MLVIKLGKWEKLRTADCAANCRTYTRCFQGFTRQVGSSSGPSVCLYCSLKPKGRQNLLQASFNDREKVVWVWNEDDNMKTWFGQ